jgi:predicted nucleic acid-binding protein
MSLPHFLDTNIFLYSISRDPTDAAKRRCAIDLLDRDDGALSVQVLQESRPCARREPIRCRMTSPPD